MRLTQEEADAFWPLYHRYRAEVEEIGRGLTTVVIEYADLYPNIPDDRAKRMLVTLTDLEKDLANTRGSYMKRFVKAIPAAKVLRLAQVENRLDLAVRLELASKVPLVPVEGDITGAADEAVLYAEGLPGGVAVRTRRISARVAAIDAANRRLTLVNAEGIKETVKVGPEAVNFDQIRSGDQVDIVATEELVVRLAEPGDSSESGGATLVELAPKGARPRGVVAAVIRATGTVTAIDLTNRTATLQFEDGSTRTLPVRSDVDLDQRKVGDQLVFQITEMVAISVETP